MSWFVNILEEFQKVERTFNQHQVCYVKKGRQDFCPGAFGHSSAHSMPRRDAYWHLGSPHLPLRCGTSTTFSASVSSSAWREVWFNPTVWESHLSDKVVPSMQPLVRAWQMFGFCFHPADATPGLVLKKVKSKGRLSSFENGFIKKCF